MEIMHKGYKILIDEEDYDKFTKWNWQITKKHGIYLYRVAQRAGYVNNSVYFHKYIMGEPKGVVVDHINGNTLDNRKCNLRICTQAENMRNQKKSTRNTSGYKGVSWSKKDKVWMARIAKNGKQIYIGSYKTPEAAYAAYCKAAKELHGEFAKLA